MKLPQPDPDATAASDRLAQRIRGAIEVAGGWIAFDDYMALALYEPGLGYYSGGATKFGAAGDFVTAPGISRLFGATLARQLREVLVHGMPNILEFGAGTGTLAADLLATLGDDCASYTILEPSPELRQRQAETLRRLAPHALSRVRWIDALPAGFSGCIVANEVLDAMPVHMVRFTDGEVLERGVVLDANGRFAFADQPAIGLVLEAARALPCAVAPDYVTEINLAAHAWMGSIATTLERGALFAIDYGFSAAEYYHPQRSRGTLMCHYRHLAHHDPFAHPGLTDITAHVDFSALAGAGTKAGLDLLGYATQANFLINCGITDVMAATSASDASAYLPLANQANRLLSPAEMGELFKVLALGRGVDGELSGFARGDRRYNL